jgi:hypothetical protein
MSYIRGVLGGRSDRKQKVEGELEGRVADMVTTSRNDMWINLSVYMYIM